MTFKLNKRYLGNGLVSRLFLQILILLIISAIFIFNNAEDAYTKFTLAQVQQEYTLLADHVSLINDHALNEMLNNNQVITPVVSRIAHTKAIRRLDTFFKRYDLKAGILKEGQFIYTNFKEKNVTTVYNGEQLTDLQSFINKELKYEKLQVVNIQETPYFIYKRSFKPWQWDILFVKSSESYTNNTTLTKKISNTLILLALFIFSLAAISYFSIFKPILQITKAITELQPPSYKGISEFQFLSDHINRTMTKLFDSIKKANKAEQAQANFLANMSHEIRTPINAIIGLNHLALQGKVDTETHNYLSKVNNASQTLLHIVNDILEYSKIEAQQLIIDKQIFSLDTLLNNLINLVIVNANEKNIEIIIVGQHDVPDQLYGDRFRIHQALLNLLNNAIKFTNSGHVILSLKQLKRKEQPLRIQFSVQDTGIGITDEQLKRLFRPFAQADSSTTRRFGGTGLGLTISQNLITLMGEIYGLIVNLIQVAPSLLTCRSPCLLILYHRRHLQVPCMTGQ
ncbi:ATP-binding protein [Psychromonas sp. MME2]|uniref:sensor histidine kinase n=1 Tax=Psychromonas sp. MME2 TaxID=3231033 RepID=UPI00339CBECC